MLAALKRGLWFVSRGSGGVVIEGEPITGGRVQDGMQSD